MTMLDAIILGAIQGLSEFLPISSSAHLVIGQAVLKVNEPSIFLEVALHLGTLLSVLIYYFKDIVQIVTGFFAYLMAKDREKHGENFRLGLYIILGSVPAGIGGLLFKDWFEAKFESAQFSGYMLLVTGVILLLTYFIKKGNKRIEPGSALAIGVAQFCAILPGISRSGSTIATGLFLGVEPRRAARYSFLLSLVAVTGAVLLKAMDLRSVSIADGEMAAFGVGAVVSFVVGIAAIHWLLKVIGGNKFYLFGYYCLLAGVFTLVFI